VERLIELVEGVFASWKAAELLARLDEIGVPAGKVRTIDEVYAWEQTRSQGLLIDVEHATLGRLQLAGPPLRFFDRAGREVTRTAHTAPPTHDQDSAAVRAWLARTAPDRPPQTETREAAVQPFCINSHGRMVFPSNFRPDLDFTLLDSLDHLERVIRRDFDAKAPDGTEILRRIEAGDHYRNRFELMRDVALNLFWTNRFAMTMYEKRPTRWRDVPKGRDDVFLPVLTPWQDAQRKVDAVQAAFAALEAAWDAQVEDEIFRVLFDVLRYRRFHATELPALKPTVAELLAEPDRLTYSLAAYDPDYPVYGDQQILDCAEDVPELEALHRWAMVLHDQYPWDRGQTRLTPVGALRDDDYVVVFHPRNRDVLDFIRRMRRDAAGPAPWPRRRRRSTVTAAAAGATVPAGAGAGAVLRAAATRGARGGEGRAPVHQRGPDPQQRLQLVADVGRRDHREDRDRVAGLHGAPVGGHRAAGRPECPGARGPRTEEIGAVLFCTCTTTRLMPSVAAWLSGQLGIAQTHSAYDIVAACAALPYGLAEATRLLQEVDRPSCWSSGRSSPTRSARSDRRG
jgi:hypothetical protein